MAVVLSSLILLPFKMLLLPEIPVWQTCPAQTWVSDGWSLWTCGHPQEGRGVGALSRSLLGAAGSCPSHQKKTVPYMHRFFILKHLKRISPTLKHGLCSCYLPGLSTISLRVCVIFAAWVICANQHSRKWALEAQACFPFQDDMSLSGSGMPRERRNPKQAWEPLGKTAELGRDQPDTCRIFKKEVLSTFLCYANVPFVGLITDLSSSNVCMNTWPHVLNANSSCVGVLTKHASQQLHFLPANWIINRLFIQETIIITKTFWCPIHTEKEFQRFCVEAFQGGLLPSTAGCLALGIWVATEFSDSKCGNRMFPLQATNGTQKHPSHPFAMQ